jgi:predicted dehydrogenase
MGRVDMGELLAQPLARVVAVCDVDSRRLGAGRALAEDFYRERGEAGVAVRAFHDHRELLARDDVDAVVVSTPDHGHARVAVDAALAGKHLYVQKPVTYDVAEAIALRRVVRATGVVLQTGSQQRSAQPWPAFRIAAEAVRNGRIGRVESVRIGLGTDAPSGRRPAPMAVPANLDYGRWLGPAPEQPYMEGRVHPQGSLDGRPGWITTECFGLGMITNWGSHHVDIAQWALGHELGGPLAVEARAEFMGDDLWTVHRTYHVELEYAGGVRVVLDDQFEVGLRFDGDEGSLFCTRGSATATSSDPNAPPAPSSAPDDALRASDPRLLAPLPDGATRLPPSRNHYQDWLEAIRDGRDPVAPIDQAARSLETCYVSWVAMKLGRKLRWDPARERFLDDDAANAMLSRTPRSAEHDLDLVLEKAGFYQRQSE